MKEKGKSKQAQDNLKVFFKEDSEFLRLLKPLLVSLQWPGDMRNLIEMLPHYSDALTLTLFRNVLARLNYQTIPIDLKLNQVIDGLLPGIFIANNQYALLLEKRVGDQFKTFDSSENKYKYISADDLIGTLYVVKEIEEAPVTHLIHGWFMANLKRFKPLFYKIIFLSCIINFFSLAIPFFIMKIYDVVIPSESMSMLISSLLGVLIILGGSFLIKQLRSKSLSYVGARLDVLVGNVLFEKILYLPPQFTENAQVGAQIARLKDFEHIREFMSSNYIATLFDLPFALLFLGVIGWLGGMVMLVPVSAFVFFSIFFFLLKSSLESSNRKSANLNEKKQNFQVETLTNLREIKVLGLEGTWVKRYEKIIAQSTMSEFRSSLITSSLSSIADATMVIVGLGIIVVGAHQAILGHLSPGELIAIMLLSWRALAPIKKMFSIIPKLEQISNSIKQIDALMQLPSEKKENKIIAPVSCKDGRIDFVRVSFRYQPDLPPALLGISFTVKPGQLVVISGKNSSGKSTLLKLISSIYLPQVGSILLDNMNTKQLDPIELRHNVAYMPQNSILFYGTIAQNLRMANPLASQLELITACQQAGCLEEIIALPKKFDTRVGDNSQILINNSFKQKLALARTYLQQCNIMLFDEPTSNFDHDDDTRFINHLQSQKGKKTILLVTHRPAHIKQADRVIYIEHGQILYDGTADQFLINLKQKAS